MKKNLLSVVIGIFSVLFIASCESDRPDPGEIVTPTNEVSNWIYENFVNGYLWEVPTNIETNLGPEEYFSRIKNPADYVSELWKTADLITTSYDIGFEYAINKYVDGKIYYVIYYIKPGTTAQASGLKRGYLITRVNGAEPTTEEHARTLMSEAIEAGTEITLTAMIPGGTQALAFRVTPQVIDENPVYFSQESTVNGNKVGYILYNNFNNRYNRNIIEKLQEFYNNNINYLILDLRYNNGGSTSTANAVASALVKGATTSDIFLIQKRRQGLTDVTLNFIDNIEGIAIPKLGDKLTRLYVITGKSTGATSEPFINSLKAYWGNDLVVVGDPTQGEGYIASSDPIQKNEWSMNIAVAFMADKNGNFNYQAGIVPGSNEIISEVNDSNVSTILGDFGTDKEAVYAKVISLIGGVRSTTETYYNDKKIISSIQDKPFAGITFVD